MGHQFFNVPICILSEDVEIDVSTWILSHWAGTAGWSPLVGVGHAWVLRFMQCPHLERGAQNALKVSGRVAWGAPVRPQSHQQSHRAPNHVINADMSNPFPTMKAGSLIRFKMSSFQFSVQQPCLWKLAFLYACLVSGMRLLCHLKIRLKEDKAHHFRISFLHKLTHGASDFNSLVFSIFLCLLGNLHSVFLLPKKHRFWEVW